MKYVISIFAFLLCTTVIADVKIGDSTIGVNGNTFCINSSTHCEEKSMLTILNNNNVNVMRVRDKDQSNLVSIYCLGTSPLSVLTFDEKNYRLYLSKKDYTTIPELTEVNKIKINMTEVIDVFKPNKNYYIQIISDKYPNYIRYEFDINLLPRKNTMAEDALMVLGIISGIITCVMTIIEMF
jgi:hypothetical protein